MNKTILSLVVASVVSCSGAFAATAGVGGAFNIMGVNSKASVSVNTETAVATVVKAVKATVKVAKRAVSVTAAKVKALL